MNLIKNNFKKLDKVLLFTSLLLFVFGLLNIVTASSREAVVRYQASLYHYFYKQSEMLIIGLILSFFILMFKPQVYKKLSKILFFVILGVCLYLFMYGTELKGATNWLNIPGLNIAIQPSEFAKIIIIVYLATLLEKDQHILQNHSDKIYEKIGWIIAVGLVIPVIVFLQKDFGTMFIMTVIFFVIFISSPIKKIDKLKTIGVLFVTALLVILLMLVIKGHIFTDAQMARFNFFEPCQKYENIGYQVCNGYIAINNGGLTGLGVGKSKQIYSYIPEPHTDSVFAIIAEEIGVLGCLLIFIAYIIIIYKVLKIGSNSSTVRGRYICVGIATYIFMHILLNLGGLFGMIPLTGVPLPFLSYGGSYTISLMCGLAFVQKVNIETKSSKKIKNNL